MRTAPKMLDVEKRAIQEFEDAVIEKAFKGSKPPVEWQMIENRYFESKLNLMDLIATMRGPI